MRKLLTTTVVTALLAVACTANAAIITHTDSIAIDSTNWTDGMDIPKFDPSLGTLNSVTFTLTGDVVGSAAYESWDAEPATITLNLGAVIRLKRPDNSIIWISVPTVSVTEGAAAFDLTTDFDGDSGSTFNNLTATDTTSVTSSTPADKALFTGAGNIVLPTMASGASNGSGAGNLVQKFQTKAGASLIVEYDYTVP